MKVKVRYFALFRDQAGVASESIDWAGGTAAELFQAMADKHAALLPEAAALVGMTSKRILVFFIATLCGMVPITLILVYTGSQLDNIETFSMAAIFSPGLILSLCLLAVFPFLARAIVGFTRRIAKSNTD